MKLFKLSAAPLILLTAASAFAHEGDDYPTHEVVEYVYDCMQKHGGQNLDNLYKCSCSIDYIKSRMTHDQFITADTFMRGQHAAGERPEILREGDLAEEQRANFEEILVESERRCYLPVTADAEGEGAGDDD